MNAVLEAEPIELESKSLAERCAMFIVTNDAEYDAAGEQLLALKSMQRRITDWIAPMVRKTHDAWRAMKDRENELLKPIQDAVSHLGRTMGTYHEACERERREQERLLREAEREEQEAETQRIAAQYAAMGNDALADAAMNAPLPPSTIKVDEFVPKAKGTAARKTYSFVIENAALLPREYMIPDEKKIGVVVRAMKDTTNIPGVRVVVETKVHARA